MSDSEKAGPTTTLGQAIDKLIEALGALDPAARATALRTACDHLSIPLASTAAQATQQEPQPGVGGTAGGSTTSPVPMDIRRFKEQKKPSSANEMAAVVAFYLSELAPEGERKKDVDFKDMETCFKQAPYRLPKAPRQLLPNARNAGYFDPLGEGRFRLNAVGYNLVAHTLPRSAEESASSRSRRRPRVNRHQKSAKAKRSKKA